MPQPAIILPAYLMLVLSIANTVTATAAEDIRYPAHVRTEAQQEAWRIGWPHWKGPNNDNSGIDCGYRLVTDMKDARKVWQSEAITPKMERYLVRSGFSSPVVAAGRVYLFYTWPTGLSTNFEDVSKDDAKALDTGRSDRTDKSDKPGDDVFLCIDAVTGKTLWKKAYEGQGRTLLGSGKGGGHFTMTIADGRTYAFGSTGRLYCLDAVTGDEHWIAETGRRTPINAPPVVIGDTVCATFGGRIHGWKVDDGEPRWQVDQTFGKGTRRSALIIAWQREGKQPLLIHEDGPTCIDPRNGKVLWRAESSYQNDISGTIAIEGDYVVVNGSKGLDDVGKAYHAGELDVDQATERYFGVTCYRMSEQGAEQVWQLPPRYAMRDYCSPAIYKGYVYILSHYPFLRGKVVDNRGPQFFLAVKLESGDIATVWNHGDLGCTYQPFAAENRWFYRGEFKYIDGADSEPLPKGSVPLRGTEKDTTRQDARSERDASPAYVCGLIYVRNETGIACWDLRQR